MRRTAVLMLALAGCTDFDGEFRRRCDEKMFAECFDAGSNGGGATGGGAASGGGSANGGGTGGGATGGGGSVSDGGMDAGCSANLDASTDHCGRCGHSCLGGACLGGVCQPVALGESGLPGPLTVDATHLYFLAGDEVAGKRGLHRVGLFDGGTRLISLLSNSSDLDQHDGHVYVAILEANASLQRANKATGAVEPFGPLPLVAGKVLSTQNSVYFAEVLSHEVGFLQLDGGAGARFASPRIRPVALAADSDALFWTADGVDSFGNDAGAADGGLFKRRFDGAGGTVTLATGLNLPYFLAVDATHAYFATSYFDKRPTEASALWRVPKAAGGQPEALLAINPRGLEVDGTGVYFTDGTDGGRGLLRRLVADGGFETLAIETAIGDLTLDAQAIYFFAGAPDGGWQVKRLAKP